MVDFEEPHAFGHGFDRDVCRGCEHEGRVLGGTMEGCLLCGCPFATMDALKAPPESCIRLDGHEGR